MVTLAITLSVPLDVQAQIYRLCNGLPSMEWIEKEDLELTLLSSGEVDGNTVLDVEEELAKLQIEPFNVLFEGLIFTPSKNARGFISLQAKENQELITLNKTIYEHLKEILKGKINKQKSPQIILGYSRELDPTKLVEYFEVFSSFATKPFIPQTLKLMKSSHANTRFTEQARYAIPTKKDPPKKSPPINFLKY